MWRRRKPPEAPEEPPPMEIRALREMLQNLPTEPVSRSHPRNWFFRIKRGLDFFGHARPATARVFRTLNPYPKPFRHVRFETEDGVTIAAWYGPAQAAPAGVPEPEDPAEARVEEGRRPAVQENDAQERSGRGDATSGAGDPQEASLGGKATANGPGDPREASAGGTDETSAAGDPREASAGGTDETSAARDPREASLRAEARQAGPQPRYDSSAFGLVIVPGMFSTKDDTVHKRRTIWLRRHWRIPVMCIDTRAFGESTGIATGGWKESLDVHAAAKWLCEHAGVERVAVLAESMGAAAALNALAHDEESGTRVMTGGALCFSAFVDLHDAVHYISTEPPKDDPYHKRWAGFRRLLRFKSHGGYERFDEYLDDAARVNGLDGFQDIVDVANPKWKTSLIKTPTLLVHATDDPVVPVRHARRMERYARDYPHIQVLIKDFGEHTGFESMDPWWFWEVCRRFFGEVNGVELPNPVGSHRPDPPDG